MIYETLINIPNMYLVALGKQQSKQTEKKICLDLERMGRGEEMFKTGSLATGGWVIVCQFKGGEHGVLGERPAWTKGWKIKSNAQRSVRLWVGGDKVRGTEVGNEQGTLKTWDATMMTLGALEGFK